MPFVGLGVGRQRFIDSGGGFDADAQAFFNRVDTAGGTLSATEKTAVNQLVLDMKDDGIWSSMKAIYPMVGASSAACAQNLKSSSFTGTFNGGWTFASTGVTGNGTNGYIDTGIPANTNLSTSSAHLSCYINTSPNNGVLLGNSNLSCFIQYSTGILYTGLANNSYIQVTTSQIASFVMGNRPSLTTLNLFKNNSKVAEDTSNNGSSYAGNVIEIARYAGGNYQNARYAFVSIGDGLTDTEASDFYTAVQAFNTTLSREV